MNDALETVVLVDAGDREVGTAPKLEAHLRGDLHRAFSVLIGDGAGNMLLQKRHRAKYHSGGLWANSCCGHPRPGETTLAAARRRLTEELGVDAPLTFGFFSRYRAALDGGMTENEFVYVYFGPLMDEPNPNPAEVAAVESLSPEEIKRRKGAVPAAA